MCWGAASRYCTYLHLICFRLVACAGTHGFRNRPPFHPPSACLEATRLPPSACSLTFCVRGCLSHCEPDQTRPDHTTHTRPGQAASNQPSQPYVVRRSFLPFVCLSLAGQRLPAPSLAKVLLAKPWSFRFSNPSSLAFDLPSAHWLIHSLL